jgi:GTP-binding protein
VLLIAVNKWDVAENASSLFNGIKAALDEGLSQLKGVPLLTVSAKTGKGIDPILKAAFELREAWSRRVGTGELNRWFEQAIETNPPPAPKGKRIKLRYITQVKTRPPSFVVFGNRTDELPDSYRRYLVNALRRDLDLGPVPLRLTFRGSRNPFDAPDRYSAPGKLARR